MTIYIGNISYDMSEDDLQNLFSEFGTVTSAKIISDKYTGRSKGFGFVEMENEIEGQTAIAELNGKQVKDRSLKVNKANPKKDRD